MMGRRDRDGDDCVKKRRRIEQNLTLAPTGVVHSIPFHSLIDEDGHGDGRGRGRTGAALLAIRHMTNSSHFGR